MAGLRESDFKKALEVLYTASEVESAVAFPRPVLQALCELVPCDVVTFHERSARPDRVLLYADDGEAAAVEAHARGLQPEQVLVRRSSLEDVFLRLTGRSLIE